MYISNEQISNEKSIIYNWLIMSGSYSSFNSIQWNGNSLYVETNDRIEYVGDRHDITDIIPELKTVNLSQLRESL
jgi:hypothetical protein